MATLFDHLDGRSIGERFEAFLADCPDVYPEFVRIALELRRRGLKHYSADAVAHIVRFHRITAGRDAEGFKVNNIYVSRLARKAMEEQPELAGFFETRKLKSA